MRETPVVLLVEPERETRERLGAWLEDAGFEALTCPGPTFPEYTCVGVREHACPLAGGADLVVLDLWLDSERAMQGASSTQLLRYYLSSGRPVMALVHRRDRTRLDLLFMTEAVTWLEWPLDRREIVETARAMIGASPQA